MEVHSFASTSSNPSKQFPELFVICCSVMIARDQEGPFVRCQPWRTSNTHTWVLKWHHFQEKKVLLRRNKTNSSQPFFSVPWPYLWKDCKLCLDSFNKHLLGIYHMPGTCQPHGCSTEGGFQPREGSGRCALAPGFREGSVRETPWQT